jgi:hypothetical protein
MEIICWEANGGRGNNEVSRVKSQVNMRQEIKTESPE